MGMTFPGHLVSLGSSGIGETQTQISLCGKEIKTLLLGQTQSQVWGEEGHQEKLLTPNQLCYLSATSRRIPKPKQRFLIAWGLCEWGSSPLGWFEACFILCINKTSFICM